MASQGKLAHDAAVDRLKRRYEQDGYKVMVPSPGQGAIPIEGNRYVPDLVVTKGKRRIVIEVKTAANPSDEIRFDKIRRVITQKSGDEFLLLYTDSGVGAKRIKKNSQGVTFKKVDALLKAKQYEAALLLAYALLEAKLWGLLGDTKRPEGRFTFSVNWPKQARHMGLISEKEFLGFNEIRILRNRVAHGEFHRVTPGQVKKLLKFYASLPNGSEASVAA
ncbi:MAG: hypothetical protein NBV67_17635 [Tagaea sp.]|nr:hypothetical protein [Tagaea sp.]